MDTSQAVGLAERFCQAASEELPVTGAWLYGSWAYGSPNEDSDIDIAVSLDPTPTDILAAEKMLYRIRRGIDTRIEPILIDIDGDRSGFSDMVIGRGIQIFPKSTAP